MSNQAPGPEDSAPDVDQVARNSLELSANSNIYTCNNQGVPKTVDNLAKWRFMKNQYLEPSLQSEVNDLNYDSSPWFQY